MTESDGIIGTFPISFYAAVVHWYTTSLQRWLRRRPGRKPPTNRHEHQLAFKRNDHLSLVLMHQDSYGYTFDWNNGELLGWAEQINAREVLET